MGPTVSIYIDKKDNKELIISFLSTFFDQMNQSKKNAFFKCIRENKLYEVTIDDVSNLYDKSDFLSVFDEREVGTHIGISIASLSNSLESNALLQKISNSFKQEFPSSYIS